MSTYVERASAAVAAAKATRADIHALIDERDRALSMLLRLYLAEQRDGWEEGESEQETRQHVHDFLYSNEIDPHLPEHAAAVKRCCELTRRKE